MHAVCQHDTAAVFVFHQMTRRNVITCHRTQPSRVTGSDGSWQKTKQQVCSSCMVGSWSTNVLDDGHKFRNSMLCQFGVIWV
jgi:hypothetical protein